MINEEIKNEINNSVNSSIGALAKIVFDIQNDNREHRKEESDSREEYRLKMLKEVKKIVETTVNGKIDSANIKLDTLISRSAAVIKQYEDSVGFWDTIGGGTKKLGIVTALIAGSILIFTYLTKLAQ